MFGRTIASGVMVATVLGVVLAPVASAGNVGGGGRPTPREFVESGLPFTFPAGTACDFDVLLSEVANSEYSRTFPNGNALITGRLAVRITNTVNGESVVRNVSGPVVVSTGTGGEDLVTLSGTSISPVFEGNDVDREGRYRLVRLPRAHRLHRRCADPGLRPVRGPLPDVGLSRQDVVRPRSETPARFA